MSQAGSLWLAVIRQLLKSTNEQNDETRLWEKTIERVSENVLAEYDYLCAVDADPDPADWWKPADEEND